MKELARRSYLFRWALGVVAIVALNLLLLGLLHRPEFGPRRWGDALLPYSLVQFTYWLLRPLTAWKPGKTGRSRP